MKSLENVTFLYVALTYLLWAFFKKTNENILGGKTPKEINEILTSEWEEIRQPVTWQEAIEARMNGKEVYFIYEGDKYEIYYDVLAVGRINGDYIDPKSDKKNIKFDMLQNGECFIED